MSNVYYPPPAVEGNEGEAAPAHVVEQFRIGNSLVVLVKRRYSPLLLDVDLRIHEEVLAIARRHFSTHGHHNPGSVIIRHMELVSADAHPPAAGEGEPNPPPPPAPTGDGEEALRIQRARAGAMDMIMMESGTGPAAGGAPTGEGDAVRRRRQRLRAVGFDLPVGSIALGTMAGGVATYDAFMKRGCTPALLIAASLIVACNVVLGVWMATTTSGRRHRMLPFWNFTATFVPIIIAMAHGGEFCPAHVKTMYDAISSLFEEPREVTED